MDPIPFQVSAEAAVAAVVALLRDLPRVRIVEESGRYVHAVFTTPVFRFRDDAEFLIDADARVIHFRSASRVGWWDMGVNRRRMEGITRRLRDRLGG